MLGAWRGGAGGEAAPRGGEVAPRAGICGSGPGVENRPDLQLEMTVEHGT